MIKRKKCKQCGLKKQDWCSNVECGKLMCNPCDIGSVAEFIWGAQIFCKDCS